MENIEITDIEIYNVELPVAETFRLAGSRFTEDKIDTTIVAIKTNNGLVGWGEGCPWGSRYLPAFAAGIQAGIPILAPHLLGQNPLHIDQINDLMDFQLKGHWYIKSALDTACWDVLGKHIKQPVYTLLGGRFNNHVILQTPIYSGTPDEMVNSLRAARKKGYTHFSARVGGEVHLDVERIKALIAELHSGEQIIFDANRFWLPAQAIQIMNAIKDTQVYFEQPCETLEECRIVSHHTNHPIILDESILDFQDLLWAQKEGIAQGIGLKIGRVGGLTKARRMRDFCVATGIKMNIEEMAGSQIANAAVMHLAIATPLKYRHATIEFSSFYSVKIAKSSHEIKRNKVIPSAAIGLGITPDMEMLGKPIAVFN